MDALPEAFALAAWQRISQEIEAAPEVKATMQSDALRLHGKSATQREFIRSIGATLHGKAWDWPQGKALLAEQLGEEPYVDDLLEALYLWFTFSTHKLHRRGQIRALLASGMGHVIHVSAETEDGQSAPCGAIDQQILVPSEEVLKRMPPCRHPFCVCSWSLRYPD